MGGTSENKPKKHICIGILAHVDAGKTTLAEAILYLCGSIRKLGRVDHKDAFLDTYALERARGITIFSKQAMVTLKDTALTLLDTPGHVDFSAEMERTLQVLDYGILVISGADGVQGHVETLWRLLKRYGIPVFLFINKMDQDGTDRQALLEELKERLDENCVDFSADQEQEVFLENLAICQERLMEEYLETGRLSGEAVQQAIAQRAVFPCYFGSALKLTGVEEFLEGFADLTKPAEAGKDFGARVFKISRDPQGSRLTHLKITGGSLKVKTLLAGEKVDQIRLYSGTGYELCEEAGPGMICAVTGLDQTFCGQGLGMETEKTLPLLEPVLTYKVELPEGCDVHRMLKQLRQLEEEEPQLHIVWKEAVGEIHVQVMGEVQVEILKSLIYDRYGVEVGFGSGSIVYKETIAAPVEGIGHFEPLRHYAEVHLLMEPGEPGSGLQFGSMVSEDELDRNWQRLILTHLEECQHPGVLTGSEITDMRIILAAGRAHQKHTEGGDFRQATYRAVRQGLKKARNILLEPVYDFTLELPTVMLGRAMTDIQKMQGSFETPVTEGELSVLKGSAPVITMRGYQTQVTAYTRGRGRLTCTLKGYEPCHNAQEVVDQIGYDSEADTEHPTGSVFCAHGAGFLVSWDRVEEFAHVDSGLNLEEGMEIDKEGADKFAGGYAKSRSDGGSLSDEVGRGRFTGSASDYITEEELEEIFTRTYGPIRRERNRFNRNKGQERPEGTPVYRARPREKQEEYLLVDGYNIIFAWEELKELARVNIDSARDKLMDILCNYQGYKQNTLILVFDAYKVKGNPGSVVKYHNIYVVYTKEAETADQYIEKTVHEIGRKYQVTVATSDALEQMIIWGQGAVRLSALGLKEEIKRASREIRETWQEKLPEQKHRPFRELLDNNPAETDLQGRVRKDGSAGAGKSASQVQK